MLTYPKLYVKSAASEGAFCSGFRPYEAGAQIDALNRTNKFEYDGLGRRTKRTLPGNQVETLGYDLAGNLISQTNFNGVIISSQYDALSRLTNRISVNGYQVSYSYTTNGQRQTMVDGSGTSSYFYDVRDRLLANTTLAGTLNYLYDANGNITNITSSTASGTSVTYQYDALNRLTNVIDARLTGTQNTAYRFDVLGNLQSFTYPNSVTNRYQYDSLNRLTNLTWKLTTTSLGDFSYQLKLGGTRTNMAETVNTVSRTNRWVYDPLYRLTNEVLLAASGSGTNTYTYDDVGNRLTRSVVGFSSPFTAPTNQTFNFDNSDRLDNDGTASTASTLFDANGNTTSYAGTFRYDVENRLTNANNGAVIITYNGDGQRVKKVTPTKTILYLVDTRNPSGYPQVLEELSVSGGNTNLSCAYTYGLDLISQRQPTVATNFYGYDGLGSVRFLLTLAGGVGNTYVYDAYGSLLNSTGTIANNYRYTGEQYDSDLGFYYLRARYLDQNIGRFQNMDTFEGSQSDPLSLHKYLYCQSNPANLTDPSGHDAVGEAIGIPINLIIPGSSTVLSYVRRGTVFYDSSKPQLPDLNSPHLVANYHSILIKNASANLDTIFTELTQMNVDGASASPVPVTGVGQNIKWRITSGPGFFGQDSFYVSTTKFQNHSGQDGPTDHFFAVVTMGGHPLRGWRFWRVYKTGDGIVVETGAVDEPNGPINRIKANAGGNDAILQLWMSLLQKTKTVAGGTLDSSGNNIQGKFDNSKKAEFIKLLQ